MKIVIFRLFLILILNLGFFQTAGASEQRWILSTQYIYNLKTALAQAKAELNHREDWDKKLPRYSYVAFPEKIPLSTHKIYARFYKVKAEQSQVIELADSPDCQGVKLCTVGSLMLKWRGNATLYYDADNEPMTKPVILHEGIQGFYTQSFALADYWPANIQWRYKEVLYTLTWRDLDDKQAFITMANSVIEQLRHE